MFYGETVFSCGSTPDVDWIKVNVNGRDGLAGKLGYIHEAGDGYALTLYGNTSSIYGESIADLKEVSYGLMALLEKNHAKE